MTVLVFHGRYYFYSLKFTVMFINERKRNANTYLISNFDSLETAPSIYRPRQLPSLPRPKFAPAYSYIASLFRISFGTRPILLGGVVLFLPSCKVSFVVSNWTTAASSSIILIWYPLRVLPLPFAKICISDLLMVF